MSINENTRIVARLHPGLDKKGLNIYNPYFESTGENTLYVLFHGSQLKPLLNGLIDLNIPGAIPAGFEKDPDLMSSMDSLDPIAEKVGKIGMIKQVNGKLMGHYQPGYGLANAIKEVTTIKGKTLCIFGSGHVTHGFIEYLHTIDELPREIHLFNRTIDKAEKLARLYPNLITRVGEINEMETSDGDIFINTTYVGSRSNKGDDYVFDSALINKFDTIADVAFVPLHSQLISLATKLNKKTSPGWKMFVHQGAYCLDTILDIDVNIRVLSELAYKDFSENW